MRLIRWMRTWKSRGMAAALGLVSTAAVFGFVGCAGDSSPEPSAYHTAAVLPAGWHEIREPITSVIYPTQAFAASTYPVTFRHRPESCIPRAALSQMPRDGVLLQVIEYPPTDARGKKVRVPKLPPRPNRFSYHDAVYASFECAGPSYKFDYRQGHHALQAQVWMHRAAVNSKWRADALRILDNFKPHS